MIKNHIMKTILHYLFRVFYFFTLCLYKPLKLLLRPIIRLHPRLYNFAATLREGLNELIRAPELTLNTNSEITSGIDSNNKIPGWLIDEWKAIHEIEPQLFPEKWLVDDIPFYNVPHSRIGEYYLELCKLYGNNNVSHVFLVPWIDRGGADIETINYIQALVNYNFVNCVTVISTFNTDSPWAYKLPDKVRFIEFGKKYSQLSEDEQEKLLTRLLIQMSPKVIHNINSDLGYKIFVKYGNALNSVSNLYASFFCTDITQEGKHVGYSYWYLPKCFDCLKAVAIDNKSFLNRLIETYAFEKEKMHVHYQPIQIDNKRVYSANINKKYIDILWAGRIDRQKRPDILIKIAQASQDLPFRFHVYGISVLDDDIFTNELTKQKNVKFYGGYNQLYSLPIKEYDLFLYTSQWDGLPNVLLEAMSLGLPVIASNVGGISELIIPDKTGFLIDPYDDIDKYLNCLKEIYNNRALLTSIINNAYELISKRHSWECFLENLNNFPGYINT